ncbi:MAG: phosphomannomutase, phosphomannomutase [Candidatus Saccharibacteria bacterium]|nr:phosphomannomutase, phosphomannomutase [Candidatus Saccharibacteria bacterium]
MSEELISAYDIRGTEETGLNVECAWNVGKALADWLPTTGKVAVVYLPAQQGLARGAIEGLRLQGRDVVDGGNGDKEKAKAYVMTAGLSGAVVIGYDELEHVNTIELYQEKAKLIDADGGLRQIRELVQAGNFVPAAVHGELTQLV